MFWITVSGFQLNPDSRLWILVSAYGIQILDSRFRFPWNRESRFWIPVPAEIPESRFPVSAESGFCRIWIWRGLTWISGFQFLDSDFRGIWIPDSRFQFTRNPVTGFWFIGFQIRILDSGIWFPDIASQIPESG